MRIVGAGLLAVASMLTVACRSPQNATITHLGGPQTFRHTEADPNPSRSLTIEVVPVQTANSLGHAEHKAEVAAAIVADSMPPASAMTLSDFQTLAIQHNPTIQALAATTQKAAGYRTQVGLRANPIVGYQGVQLADRNTDQHTLFVEKQFIRGGKLELNQRVLNEALRSQRLELDSQQLRVLTDVEVKFLEVLSAQRRIDLVAEFRSVVEKGLELSELRLQAEEGTKIDVLQSKIQKNEIELALQQAEIVYATSWRELVTIIGTPELQPMKVLGELPTHAEPIDWNTLAMEIVSNSPEMAAAQARIAKARANISRQTAQTIPNITTQFAAGYDNGMDSGMINLQVGAPIPSSNRNQGNISAAQAEFCLAMKDAERIELSILSRLAVLRRDYDSALAAVQKYQLEILPSALESLQLSDAAYRAGESSFVQVLVARKTYFESNMNFLDAQTRLAQARARLAGLTLTGALDRIVDDSGDDSLRNQALDQQ